MNCVELLKKLLDDINIAENEYSAGIKKIMKQKLDDQSDVDYLTGKIFIINTLIDTYSLNASNVKRIADKISKNYSAIGRYEKDLIKHYLDYMDEDSFNNLYVTLQDKLTKDALIDIINTFKTDFTERAIQEFKSNWYIAVGHNDDVKLFDYLQGIYTRLITAYNVELLSLKDIYSYNLVFIKEELKGDSFKKLEMFCKSTDKKKATEARREFNDYYSKLLDEDLVLASNSNSLEKEMNKSFSTNTPFYELVTESYGQIVINIDQEVYDSCPDFHSFMDLVLSMLQQSYRLLKNHRNLVVKISNIFTKDNKNIKWLLYSYIGIYAEHFIPVREKRKFYKPESLCIDKCSYLGIELDENRKKMIKDYFEGMISKSELQSIICEVNIDEILLDFENVWYGYTFSDCLSIINGEHSQNSEISFIKNNNEIILIFNKYRHDDRKIPCPECSGLNISGNSFPEVGLRSWECKNIICPSRSKSNRGKRYSNKSNFMQRGFEDGTDVISKEFIKNWRRDIARVNSNIEISDMLIKYFSFTGENVLFINYHEHIDANERLISKLNYKFESISNNAHGIFKNYFKDGNYTRRYMNQIKHSIVTKNENITKNIVESNDSILISGDSRSVLAKLNDNIFSAAVTSPPYYNARLYSQWPNLYLYLSDMYEIIKETYRTLKPGAVYLYNIGDICGNENTIVNSNMGNKRILLGAYTIHLFIEAGFELMDNILWDKGEPQSNRQKNDGKFTPFYQKPMNVYEHMFIFKKPGAECILNPRAEELLDEHWKTNISSFTPVIKINSKGENTLGHTAPFPLDIPDFVCKVFTNDRDNLILEPFAGSGTSIVSAFKNNRRCVGIELCDEYVKLIESICQQNNVKIKKLG